MCARARARARATDLAGPESARRDMSAAGTAHAAVQSMHGIGRFYTRPPAGFVDRARSLSLFPCALCLRALSLHSVCALVSVSPSLFP
eukprot:COSAG03_NODE_19681_length_332_cov_0.643777_1_plen_87_part_10